MGWPEFPSEDESLDRAHFFQANRAEVCRMMESAGELPVVRDYVLERRGNAILLFGQEMKKLVEKLEKCRIFMIQRSWTAGRRNVSGGSWI
jgi:hypothetical protein